TARVDEAILGVYLRGGNTRRLKGALAPLLRGGPLGKDAVSRLVGRLAADFETWRQRELGTEDIRYLFCDGWYPCVRIGKRRERVPILVTLGVRASGERVVLDLRLVGQESAAGWRDAIDGLVAGRLRCAPVVASLEEAGDELFTFLGFPASQWKALRTTDESQRSKPVALAA